MLKIVGLSAGHFSGSGQATHQGVSERQIAEQWVRNISRNLDKQHGIATVVAPDAILHRKVEYFNRTSPRVIVEVHFNANIKVSGCETLYYPGSRTGRYLASIVHETYAPFCNNKDRGIKEGWYRMDRPKIKDYPGDREGDEVPLYLLKRTKAPCLIVEPEFIYHLDKIVEMEDKVCEAIASGLNRYLET